MYFQEASGTVFTSPCENWLQMYSSLYQPENSDTVWEQEDKLQELENSFEPANEDSTKIRILANSFLMDTFRNALAIPEQLARVHGIMTKLSQHADPSLRSTLMKMLPRLAYLCCDGDRLDHVNARLCPLILSCLPDNDDEVRKASETALLVLMKRKYLAQERVEEACLLVVEISKMHGYASTVAPALMSRKLFNLSAEEEDEEDEETAGREEKAEGQHGGHKVIVKCIDVHITATLMTLMLPTSSSEGGRNEHPWLRRRRQTDCWPMGRQLMGRLAPLIGREATEKHFLDRFVCLCSDEKAVVRETCAKSLGDMCTVLGTETTEKLLVPLFVQLSRDKCRNVRLTCAEVSVSVSCSCSLATRKTVLTAVFTRLLMDNEEYVQATAFAFLGAFICTFADPSVTRLDYDENGELIFVGQDGYEFRMQSVHINYLRDMESMENMKDLKRYPGERILLKSADIPDDFLFFAENCTGHSSLPKLNLNQRLFKIYEQLVPGMPWTMPDKQDDTSNANANAVDAEKPDDSFNTFRFWRMPLPQLDSFELEPDQDDIRNNLNILDNELSFLSEKLAECSPADLEDVPADAAVSAWNAAETPPHIASSLAEGTKIGDGFASGPGTDSFPETAESNLPNQEIVPQLLLDCFVSMTVPLQDESLEQEIAQDCAYSLPAVALTLGPANWPYIKNAYKCLSMNIKWRVRRTLVSSIHKLASILGEEIASKDLAPIFEGFIRDLDEVKIEALEHLADFLRLVNSETRNSFLPRLKEFLKTDFDWNWRYREKFGQQLRLLLDLFTPADWLEHFEPLATLLLCDKVAAVRHKAVLLFLDLLMSLSREPEFQEKLLYVLLKKFAEHSSWRRRQVFVLVCSEIAKQVALNNEDFSVLLLDHLSVLSKDPVANVGVGVARCLSVDIISTGYISSSSPHYSTIIDILEKLKTHSDSDIRYFASLHEEVKNTTSDFSAPLLEPVKLET